MPPRSVLVSIGLWSEDFEQVEDEEVVELHERRGERDERGATGPEGDA